MTRRRAKKPRKRVAVAYLRVSTDAERQELGAEAQRAAIEAWAAKEGYEIAWTEVEEVSGGASLEDRPKLMEAVAAVKALKAQALVCHRFTRFSRDPLVALLVERELDRAGAVLLFAEGGGGGEDPSALLMRRILAAVGEFDRLMIRAQIRAALAVKQRRGEMIGKAPYGFRSVDGPTRPGKDGALRVVRVLERDPAEQATIARARELAAQEGTTVRSIQATLAAEGRLNRKGNPFGLEELHRMIRGEEAA